MNKRVCSVVWNDDDRVKPKKGDTGGDSYYRLVGRDVL
jgi:hypothetical protein